MVRAGRIKGADARDLEVEKLERHLWAPYVNIQVNGQRMLASFDA